LGSAGAAAAPLLTSPAGAAAAPFESPAPPEPVSKLESASRLWEPPNTEVKSDCFSGQEKVFELLNVGLMVIAKTFSFRVISNEILMGRGSDPRTTE
jgi:hypothetical protein